MSWDSPLQDPKPCSHILGWMAEKKEYLKNFLIKRSMKMQKSNRSKFLNQILTSMLNSSITFTCLDIPKLDVWLLSVKQRAQEILQKRAFSYKILGISHLPIYLLWTLSTFQHPYGERKCNYQCIEGKPKYRETKRAAQSSINKGEPSLIPGKHPEHMVNFLSRFAL